MKKKIIIILILVLITIPLLFICCITVIVLSVIAKYSSGLPEADLKLMELAEKPYICEKAKEKNYSSNIKDYDPVFSIHNGIDATGSVNNFSYCLGNKDSTPTPYTIHEIIAYEYLDIESESDTSCMVKLLKMDLFSFKLFQKQTNQEIEEFFVKQIEDCKKESL
jgi:hypothetical protein